MYILSRYLRNTEQGSLFHFKGYFKGNYVSKIIVENELEFETNEEYLLKIGSLVYREKTLIVKVVKFKKLFNFQD